MVEDQRAEILLLSFDQRAACKGANYEEKEDSFHASNSLCPAVRLQQFLRVGQPMSDGVVYDQGMRKHKPITRGRGQVNSPAAIDINDFDQLTAIAGETVEHATVPGFLRRIEHPWHIDDLTRFGDKVGRVAEAMQLSYLTTIQPQLGMIRVFPLPLLQRVYELMAPQFQWPAEPLALLEGRRALREELKRHERADADLQQIRDRTESVTTLESIETVRKFLADQMTALRAELSGVAAGVSPAV
jgi:hypothetical protein